MLRFVYAAVGILLIPCQAFSQTPPANPEEAQAEREVRSSVESLIEKWNSRDLEGFLEYFWQSEKLLIVEDRATYIGWNKLKERFINTYSDRRKMGHISLDDVHIEAFAPDLVEVVSWFTFDFEGLKSFATDTSLYRKFDGKWKIVSEHSAYLTP